MIDLSTLRAPAWQRVVAELTAAASDDRSFLVRLVSVLGQVSGARQALLWTLDRPATREGEAAAEPEPRVLFSWPADGSGPREVEGEPEARSAAMRAAESAQVRLFGLGRAEGVYEPDERRGHLIAVPLASTTAGAGDALVVTLLIESRSNPALQTTLAMVEIVAGYVHGHAARREAMQTRHAAASLDLAARLIADVHLAEGFRGAAMSLCNDLVRQLKVDRVAMGWVRGVGENGSVHVVALSDTEHIDRRLAMVRKLEAAMDECLDQEQPVVYPPPPEGGEGGDLVLAQAITHAHRDLAAGDARVRVASLPLRAEVEGESRVLGVVTIEASSTDAISVQAVELLQASLDLVAPLLRVRRSDDRTVATRAWRSVRRGAAWAVGTRHTAWKLVALLALAVLATLVFVSAPYNVSAEAALHPVESRVVSMPYDGQIAHVEPRARAGLDVREGDLLARLDTTDLALAIIDARSELRQHETEADEALKQGKQGERNTALARAQRVQARIDMLEDRVRRADIRAPIAGVVIEGDLTDKIGATLKIGERLFEVAPRGASLVVAHVDDRDIRLLTERVRELDSRGEAMVGRLSTKAYPALTHEIVLERIVPLARAGEGRNTFEVWARLESPELWMSPGIEGVAKFDVGDRSLMAIGSRRIVDALRLWLWW